MKAKKVLKLLQVTRPTLCAYVRKGYIKTFTMPSGRYEYDDNSVYEFMGIKNRATAVYARILSDNQEYLDEQIKHCIDYANSHGYSVTETYKDNASGYDIDRSGFLKLFHDVVDHKVKTVIIACGEALSTTGFDAWFDIFKESGCEIIIAEGYELPNELKQNELNKFTEEIAG